MSTAVTTPARSVLIQEGLEIPLWIANLDDFRRWTHSEDFPEQGRIDYVDGRIEVDTMVEDPFLYGTPKVEIARVIANRVKQQDLGDVFIDATRVACPAAGLSVEPDLIFVSHSSIKSGRVTLVDSPSGKPGSYIEILGPPDLVLEVVSNSSVQKDTVRLLDDYHKAGVPEYWLVDARAEDQLSFAIWTWHENGFEQSPTDQDGYQRSEVLNASYRFERTRRPDGRWTYDLLESTLHSLDPRP
ncbi:MAG: Uma2 family endonuclease [Planctomycetota bacterium]|nr:MAG: Uma2 family endonuclease [Planctomycetota bacterium]REJ97726.1 MAG: Uma2 family endonuclease [Planctomycetota bacterium]REK26660.1 MAG: Uma2 family endonuclease [Planctomycetota bacterium]REK35681.1 MAG: Uma2 family endonuclease [Planctomycetota bacterium]